MRSALQNIIDNEPAIVTIGVHKGIIQSMLDFDYLSDNKPSIKAIIGNGKKYERFFFGEKEIIIPVYDSPEKLPATTRKSCNALINLISGRRVLYSTIHALESLPSVSVLAIFAEEVPEQQAIHLRKECAQRDIIGIGPATVGLLIPGQLKLGAIGGVDYKQLQQARLHIRGSIAVMSSSGGMTNELINLAAQSGFGVSFAVAFGGEFFPILKPIEAFIAAEQDSQTRAIIYFGELGGSDEYELAEALKTKAITKPVIAYIAGRVAELFAEPPQFGHAKAMAQSLEETAIAKQAALRTAGAIVPETFGDFVRAINSLTDLPALPQKSHQLIGPRRESLFISSIAHTDSQSELRLVGKTLHEIASDDYAHTVVSMLLGHQVSSEHTAKIVELILKLLIDHGPHVSGAVNTMIAASANRDLTTSVATGLLTIGSRFGGAVNGAAAALLYGVENSLTPAQLVEEMARQKIPIPGIGHKKYNIGLPDPRVTLLTASLTDGQATFLDYAHEIERITTKKGSSLILNVDGAIAACLLDTLHEHEGYTIERLKELASIDFFNAFFVAARSVGFIAHYLDQRRLDQGLFRLGADQVAHVDLNDDNDY